MKLTLLLSSAIILGIWLKPLSPDLFVTTPLKPITKASTPIPTATPTPSKAEIVYEIAKAFEPEGANVIQQALNVAKNESGWRHDAQGWNCHYYDENGKRYSAACKEEDRPLAWSVDCGTLQINVKGTVCPVELFDVKINVSKALSMYKRRAWQPWVAAQALGYVN